MIKRGDVYWVDLNKAFPEGSHYQRNIRPCVIMSNEKNNKFCGMLTVVPLTTKRDYFLQQISPIPSSIAFVFFSFLPHLLQIVCFK